MNRLMKQAGAALGLAMVCAAQAAGQSPLVTQAAQQLNQLTPPAMPLQVVRLGVFDGTTNQMIWALPAYDAATGAVASAASGTTSGGVGGRVKPPSPASGAPSNEPTPAVSPMRLAVINSMQVRYEIELRNITGNLVARMATPGKNGTITVGAVISQIPGKAKTATIAFTPFTNGEQALQIQHGAVSTAHRIKPHLQEQLGAFIVPHLLLSIVYEPPGQHSTAQYTAENSRTVLFSWDWARQNAIIEEKTSDLLKTLKAIEKAGPIVGKLTGHPGIGEAAGSAAGVIQGLMAGETTVESEGTTSGQSTGSTITIKAGFATDPTDAYRYPGQGDRFVVLNDVLWVYAVSNGRVHLAPVAYGTLNAPLAAELTQKIPADLADAYLRLDPLLHPGALKAAGARSSLFGPRFEYMETWQCETAGADIYEFYQAELSAARAGTVKTTTKTSKPPELIAGFTGAAEQSTTVTYTALVATTQSSAVAATISTWCDDSEGEFLVDLYLDRVFRSLMPVRGESLPAMVMLSGVVTGDSNQPLPRRKVRLQLGDRTYAAVSDAQGQFAFRLDAAGRGAGTLMVDRARVPVTIGDAPVTNFVVKAGRAGAR